MLEHSLKYPDGQAQSIINGFISNGHPVPDKLICPDLPDYLLFDYYAFCELSTCRVEMGHIPWTAISSYATRYNVHDFVKFHEFISYLDNRYLEYQSRRIKNQKE